MHKRKKGQRKKQLTLAYVWHRVKNSKVTGKAANNA